MVENCNYICICRRICIRVCVCVCKGVCICICIYVYMYRSVYVYMYICIYVFMYTVKSGLTDTGSTDILLIRHEFSGPRQHSPSPWTIFVLFNRHRLSDKSAYPTRILKSLSVFTSGQPTLDVKKSCLGLGSQINVERVKK